MFMTFVTSVVDEEPYSVEYSAESTDMESW